jgi:hypothetical protein
MTDFEVIEFLAIAPAVLGGFLVLCERIRS